MFRRRTSSPGKIHYRVNINKNMCLGFVDIYIDGKPYQSGFNGKDSVIPREGGRPRPSGPPPPYHRPPFFLASQVLSLTGYQKFISLEQNYNHV